MFFWTSCMWPSLLESCSASAKTIVLHLPQMYLSIPNCLLTVHKSPSMLQSPYRPSSSLCLQVSGFLSINQPQSPWLSGTPCLPPEMNLAVTCQELQHLCSIPYSLSSTGSDITQHRCFLCPPAGEEMVACSHMCVASEEPWLNPAHFPTMWHLCQVWSRWEGQ